MIKLRLKKHPATLWKFVDNTAYISIGRSKSNDVTILEKTLSRNHATITHRAGAYILQAESENNITQVNNETVKSKRLKTGDEIRLGEVELIFQIDDGAEDGSSGFTDDGVGATDFYRELLSIPEGPRPPNHYQLIGVKNFESNIEQIKKASLKRVASLRKRQLDQRYGDAVQQLLTEVARARVILCNPYSKAPYDSRLKRKEAIESGGAVDADALEELAALEGDTYEIISEDIDMTMEERLEALRRNAEFMILEAGINPQERDNILRKEAEGFGVDLSEVGRIVQEILTAKNLAGRKRPLKTVKRERRSQPNAAVVLILLAIGALVIYLIASRLKPSPLEEMTNTIGMKLVLVPPGKFMMGSEGAEKHETPVHEVRITKPFYIGKFEATQAEWKAVMGNNPSRLKNDKLPVQNVSWTDCADFCEMLSEKEGATYRLPTEAEWEYACRAGATTKYSFGDDDNLLDEYAWYKGNSSGKLHRGAKKKPNGWGIYSMHGNLFEWCADWYDEHYYMTSPSDDPKGPDHGVYRVIRGGNFYSEPRDCRAALRLSNLPHQAVPSYGFRVVRLASPTTETPEPKLVAKSKTEETPNQTDGARNSEEQPAERGEPSAGQETTEERDLDETPPAFPGNSPERLSLNELKESLEPPADKSTESQDQKTETQEEDRHVLERSEGKFSKLDQVPDVDKAESAPHKTIVERARQMAKAGKLKGAIALISENEAGLGEDETQSIILDLQQQTYTAHFDAAFSLLREGDYDKCVTLWDNALSQFESPAFRKSITWDKRIAEIARDMEAKFATNAAGKELETEYQQGMKLVMKIASTKGGIVTFTKGKLAKKTPLSELPSDKVWELAFPDTDKKDSEARLELGVFLLVNNHPDARQYLSDRGAPDGELADLEPNLAVYEAKVSVRREDYGAALGALDKLKSKYESSDFYKARERIVSNIRKNASEQRSQPGKGEKILFKGEWLTPMALLENYVVKSRSYVQSFFGLRRNDLFDEELKQFYEPDLWKYILRELPPTKSRSKTIRLRGLRTKMMELSTCRVLDFQPSNDEIAEDKWVAAKATVTVVHYLRMPVLEAEWEVKRYRRILDRVRQRGSKKEEINKTYSCLLIRQSEALQDFFDSKERNKELISGGRSKTRNVYKIPSDRATFWQSIYFVDNESGIVIAVFYEPEFEERFQELKMLMESAPKSVFQKL